ncbi:MAG: hypothetical protein R2810_04795 [Flavobacteriales bacterium]
MALLWNTGDTSTTLNVCDTVSSWYTLSWMDDTLCTAMDSAFVQADRRAQEQRQ